MKRGGLIRNGRRYGAGPVVGQSALSPQTRRDATGKRDPRAGRPFAPCLSAHPWAPPTTGGMVALAERGGSAATRRLCGPLSGRMSGCHLSRVEAS